MVIRNIIAILHKRYPCIICKKFSNKVVSHEDDPNILLECTLCGSSISSLTNYPLNKYICSILKNSDKHLSFYFNEPKINKETVFKETEREKAHRLNTGKSVLLVALFDSGKSLLKDIFHKNDISNDILYNLDINPGHEIIACNTKLIALIRDPRIRFLTTTHTDNRLYFKYDHSFYNYVKYFNVLKYEESLNDYKVFIHRLENIVGKKIKHTENRESKNNLFLDRDLHRVVHNLKRFGRDRVEIVLSEISDEYSGFIANYNYPKELTLADIEV